MDPTLVFLLAGSVAAGLVRGFAGFGTAMVFLPFAAQVLSPFEAIAAMIVMDVFGPLPSVPGALRAAQLRDVLRLAGGMAVALPLGLWLLTFVAPELFRYSVSLISLALLILLVAGLRYRGTLHRWLVWATGAASGFLGGIAGIAGPPVILLYMASTRPAAAIRANITLFLILNDIAMLFVLSLLGKLTWAVIWTGVTLIPAYLLANLAGAAIFRPEYERLYRVAAYVIIAGSALSGLPLWD